MSQYCTSYFLFAFNERPVVLANFRRDFRFSKILHISLYRSFVFSRAIQAHATCLICLSTSLSSVSESRMRARWASKLAKGSLWLGLHNLNYFSSRNPRVPCPFFQFLTKRISLDSESEVLETQQPHQGPKVLTFALQIIYKETERMQNLERCLQLKLQPTFALL